MRSLAPLLTTGLLCFLSTGCAPQTSGGTTPMDTETATRITMVSVGGMPEEEPAGHECDTTYRNTVFVDLGASTVGWDYCAGGFIAKDQRALAKSEAAAVKAALANLEVGSSGNCGADAPVVTLDVESSDHSVEHYVDDFYSCEPPPVGRTFVKHMDVLESRLWSLLPPPAQRLDPDFERLTLVSTGAYPEDPLEGAECGYAYVDTYLLDRDASTLAWDYCQSGLIRTGQRPLSASDLATIGDTLSKLELGSRDTCGADAPTVTLDLERKDQSVDRYIDDFNSCNKPAPDGRTYVKNLMETFAFPLEEMVPQE